MKKIIIVFAILLSFTNSSFSQESQNKEKLTVLILKELGDTTIIQINKGDTIPNLAIPVKENSTFIGWYREDRNAPWDSKTPVTEDSIKIIAQWESNEKIAELNLNNEDSNKFRAIFDRLLPFIALGLTLLFFGLTIFALLNKRQFRNNLLKELERVEPGGRMEYYQQNIVKKAIKEVKRELPIPSSQPVKINEKELEEMVVRIVRQTLAQNYQRQVSNIPDSAPVASIEHKNQIYYADSINANGYFNNVTQTPNEDTVFELDVNNAGTVTYTVYGRAYSRVLRRPEFLKGCDVQHMGSTRLEVTPGTAQEQDGKYIVTTKANVIIH